MLQPSLPVLISSSGMSFLLNFGLEGFKECFQLETLLCCCFSDNVRQNVYFNADTIFCLGKLVTSYWISF